MYLKLFSLVAVVTLGLANFAESDPPSITSAQPNLSTNTIAISGTGFGSVRPTVNLSTTPLTVTSFSPTAITATLPTGLNAGTYALVVTSNSPPTSSAVLDVTIGAVGPAGPMIIPVRAVC